MPLPPLHGHEGLRDRLEGSIASGRLPQALLLCGPTGIGKQRLGLHLAQRLLCERAGTSKAPCGECQHCVRVLSLTHPDLHWFVPLEPSKKALDEGKKLEWVEESLAEILAARRADPLYQRAAGMASHSMASVRLLLRRLHLKPALAARKVFLLGDAERLVVQEASQEAANALLKALEEPPPGTYLILTASDADALLPTIRSRVVTVRVPRLPDTVVTAFLQRERKLPAAEAKRRAGLSGGSIGIALAADLGPAPRSQPALRLGRGPADRYQLALAQAPWSARGDFTALLDGWLADLRAEVQARPDRRSVRAIELVLEKRGLAQGNVNPQLLLARLLDELAAVA